MRVSGRVSSLMLSAALGAGCTSKLKQDLQSGNNANATPSTERDAATAPISVGPSVAPSTTMEGGPIRPPPRDAGTPAPTPTPAGSVIEPEPESLSEPESLPEPEPLSEPETSAGPVPEPEVMLDDDSPMVPVGGASGQTPDVPSFPDAAAPVTPTDAGAPTCEPPCLFSEEGTLACVCPEPADSGAPVDACPNDPAKTEPGSCGCGFEEVTFCAELSAVLAHRYAFDGTGTVVTDSRGTAHGEVVGTTLSDGRLTLGGAGSAQYVDLPNGLVSSFTDLTIELWTTWNGGDPWQKLFDFGSSDAGEGVQGVGVTGLFVTPNTETDNVLRVGFKPSTGNEMSVSSTLILPSGTLSYVAVVFDDTSDSLSLYEAGVLVLQGQLPGSLSQIDDVNNWLGRSQWLGNPDYDGTIEEFRLYGAALSGEQLAYSASMGPDAAFLAR